MAHRFINSFCLSFGLCLCVLTCQDTSSLPQCTVTVSIKNHKTLDSLIIYDKDKQWDILSVMRFNSSKVLTDTLVITAQKNYQMYVFSNGTQDELGELILSPHSKVDFSFDELEHFASVNYTGTFKTANNFMAFSKYQQEQLSKMVRDGISQEDLAPLLKEKRKAVVEQGRRTKVNDSILTYGTNKFDRFTDVLVKKNEKYLYKSRLVDTPGNGFSFKDKDGKDVSLIDFKGQYVYIDVWATWCKPCKVEHQFLETLEAHFINTDALQIMSISIDKNYDTWNNYTIDTAMEGLQLYSGDQSDFVKFYDIGALPRFILLDKEGRIISPDYIRPSQPELLDTLESIVESKTL